MYLWRWKSSTFSNSRNSQHQINILVNKCTIELCSPTLTLPLSLSDSQLFIVSVCLSACQSVCLYGYLPFYVSLSVNPSLSMAGTQYLVRFNRTIFSILKKIIGYFFNIEYSPTTHVPSVRISRCSSFNVAPKYKKKTWAGWSGLRIWLYKGL